MPNLDFEIFFKSTAMERNKIAKRTRCGTTKAEGTAMGKLKKAGKMIVTTGIVSNKLNGWRSYIDHASLVFNKNAIDIRKITHSNEMLKILVIFSCAPYHSEKAGHNT